MAVVSAVPAYNPTSALVTLARELARHGPVVISDDGSAATSDPIFRELQLLNNVQVIRHRSNSGTARGLNDGLRIAQSIGAQWLLTVDQDSTLAPRYVEEIIAQAMNLTHSGHRVGAFGAGNVIDMSGPMSFPTRQVGQIHLTSELLQSGTLWSIPALEDIGGFEEELGSDAVDAAACLSLRERGFTVSLCPDVTLHHQVGRSRRVTLLGHSIMVTQHSQERYKAMVKNRLRLFPREFRQSPVHALRTVRRVVTNMSLAQVLRDG